MAIGGLANYPTLESIANLVRTIVNDDQQGLTGADGEGQILTDSSVTLQNLMNSAIRDTYRDVRIMGQPTLIKDNYIVTGLPPVNSALGVGVANPAVQTSLQYAGFFDGVQIWPNLILPSDMIFPLKMWERESNTNNAFGLMNQTSGALSPRNQTGWLGEWEWRADGIWMNGATQYRDVRLRYICTFPDLVSSNIDWSTTYVPIMDSQECIADKIAVRYVGRLGGAALADARESARVSLLKLRQQICRDRQMIDYQRPIFGNGAGSAGDPSTYLY